MKKISQNQEIVTTSSVGIEPQHREAKLRVGQMVVS